MLQNASNLSIGYAIQHNHFAQTPEVRGDAGLKELYTHVAVVAMHFSKARVDAPKCLEETREAVQDDIGSWSDTRTGSLAGPSTNAGTDDTESVLWLTGPAGTGKTAIMGTMADRLAKKGQLAATFYFSEAMGASGTTSSHLFVTTLAYQLAVHPKLKGRLAALVMSTFQDNPAVFDMNLEQQLEVLIIEPLKAARFHEDPGPSSEMCVLVDGVDECGGSGEGKNHRSRQDNQVEVLSVLLRAAKEPAFPFHIIVASRPETWIRGYLEDNATGTFHEIFLDEKYSPDDDIRLYLKSKFAERRRWAGISSAWPRAKEIEKLVESSSGQFIYAATVVRWVGTPGASPQAQLDAVLNLKIPPGAESHPLAMLDALYTSILKSTPNPDTTVLWLKGLHHVQQVYASNRMYYTPSAWTLDRIFESHEGQARSVLGGLPSLVYKLDGRATDLTRWGEVQGDSMLIGLSTLECEASYAFYHKSFLDYLDGDSRCGAEFTTPTGAKGRSWLDARISQTLKSPGAEVSMSPPLVYTFQKCFMELVINVLRHESIYLDLTDVVDGIPDQWIRALETTPALRWSTPSIHRALYILAHGNCHQGLPCNRGCKQWRRAISKLPSEQWCTPRDLRPWTKEDLRLDRFCIKRLSLEANWK